MPKNIVQDVIPSKKSIRNISLPSKSKKQDVVIPTPQAYPVPPSVPPESIPPYKYEYDEPLRPSRKVMYVSIILFVLAAAFGVSAMFKSANIRVTPKQEVRVVSGSFKALKNVSAGGLGFQMVTTSKEAQLSVDSTGEQKVEKKARGTIVVYNNTTQSQKLVATTRFQTPEGLVFRAVSPVTVPSKQVKGGKSVAGSIGVVVEADKVGPQYNIGLKDFTIPGFKGDPKYTQIYARSKTEMVGGFVGLQRTVSEETMQKTDEELEAELRSSLLRDLTSQIPDNFILYSNGLFYTFGEVSESSSSLVIDASVDSVVLKKKASLSAIIFDKGSLSKAVVLKVIPEAVEDQTKIINIADLNFTLPDSASFDPINSTSIDFGLEGNANFVWVFDENKLKTELLGLSKENGSSVIATYPTIKEAWIETYPFWNKTIPADPKDVTIINTVAK